MPRAKRPLAEADPNASMAEPAAKKAGTKGMEKPKKFRVADKSLQALTNSIANLTATIDKEQKKHERERADVPAQQKVDDLVQSSRVATKKGFGEFESKPKKELIEDCKAVGLPYSGVKSELVDRLALYHSEADDVIEKPVEQDESDLAVAGPSTKQSTSTAELGREQVDYQKKTVKELIGLFTSRNLALPSKRMKALLIQRLEEVDQQLGNDQAPVDAKEQPATAPAQLSAPAGPAYLSTSPSISDPAAWAFVTICRSTSDVREEKGEVDEDYDSDEDEDMCGTKACMCRKSIAKFPEWKWVMTRKGLSMVSKFNKEILHRDQDFMNKYFYNDYSGYGFQEAVENQLLSFDKVVKKGADPFALWHHIEAFAHGLPGCGTWFMADISDDILSTLECIGEATLTTLNVLDKHNLLRPDSPVKDLGLVAGILINVIFAWPGDINEPELGWVGDMVRSLTAKGVSISGAPYQIEKAVQRILAVDDEEEVSEATLQTWNAAIKSLSIQRLGLDAVALGGQKIGGREFDISNTKPIRQRYIVGIRR